MFELSGSTWSCIRIYLHTQNLHTKQTAENQFMHNNNVLNEIGGTI